MHTGVGVDAAHGLCYGRGSPLDLIQRRLLRAGHGVVCIAEELISYYQVDYMSGDELTNVGGIAISGVQRLRTLELQSISALRQIIRKFAATSSSFVVRLHRSCIKSLIYLPGDFYHVVVRKASFFHQLPGLDRRQGNLTLSGTARNQKSGHLRQEMRPRTRAIGLWWQRS